jgi:Zn ribbon nucleic-acid-binding protein
MYYSSKNPNECPKCKETDCLELQEEPTLEINPFTQEYMAYIEFECTKCGAKGRQVFDLEFKENAVQDK